MDFRNVPSRAEVLSWTPDVLADYFKKLNYKDCEKVVKKHSINGQRFLSMSENDIQKFPKLAVPIISRLSQEIYKKQERKNPFRAWTQPSKVPEEPGPTQEEADWSSFDEDSGEDDNYETPDDEKDNRDYESPELDSDCEAEDGRDYESPVEDVDRDYEPPPSNNEPTHIGAMLPAKPIIGTSDYVDRISTVNNLHSPPVPPQRPMHSSAPLPPGSRGNPPSHYPSPNNDDKKSSAPLKRPAPKINRNTKPRLDQLGVHTPLRGIKTVPHKTIPIIPKYPQPNDKMPVSARTSTPPPRPSRAHDTNSDKDEHSGFPRPLLPPAIPSYHSNTFPQTVPQRPSIKPSPLLPGSLHAESVHSTGSLPSHSPKGVIVSKSFSHADPISGFNKHAALASSPNKQPTMNNDWFVGDISRSVAEECLRRIDKDGTFLVRNSSRKTVSHPFVLMVLFNDKVYNIQIRYDQRQHNYLLGTAGKEHFLSVQEMIDFFTRTPLLLIDGKDPDSRYQCILKYAAECS